MPATGVIVVAPSPKDTRQVHYRPSDRNPHSLDPDCVQYNYGDNVDEEGKAVLKEKPGSQVEVWHFDRIEHMVRQRKDAAPLYRYVSISGPSLGCSLRSLAGSMMAQALSCSLAKADKLAAS